MRRYFTKSLHKKALECPTKLFYQSKPEEYDNSNLDDPFLKALASGGFQVGELAKIYFPDGIEITAIGSDEAIQETSKYLVQENVVLFEPAIVFGDFLVRIDVLVKQGDSIRIYEVKAKSFHPTEDVFYNKTAMKKGQYLLASSWKPYLYDVAFQTMVCEGAFPSAKVLPYMIFADKSQVTTVDGLNQRFFLSELNGRTKVKVAKGTDLESVGSKILCSIDVSEPVQKILAGEDFGAKTRAQLGMPSFHDEAQGWAKAYLTGEKLATALNKDCRGCEFRTTGQKKSGFDECWTSRLKAKPVKGELVIDVWNFRDAKSLIEEGRLLIKEMTKDDLKIKEDPRFGMSQGERQWLQVEKVTNRDMRTEIDRGFLKDAMRSWKFPLHCIDFETTMVAIPFHAGKRPYEQIAFQFSHHILTEDGQVEHVGQYLHKERGEFPNFDFLRALKSELEKDDGSIFRYSNHENTVLCQIYSQLQASQEPDREELKAFIRTITRSEIDGGWEGERNMIDLCELVKKGYYNPLTKGSNSIKKVLPAVLSESKFLREKYAKAIYGAFDGISSLNFKNKVWLERDSSGNVVDPYKQLPPVFEGIDQDLIEGFLSDGDELAEGGAAMMAFAKMQFTEMTEIELEHLCAALLRYCELDTLAMIMLIEHFLEVTDRLKARSVA